MSGDEAAAAPAAAGGGDDPRPYRLNVGAVLLQPGTGRVLVARRADLPDAEGAAGGWQLPQGGLDEGEDPRAAVLRELAEEVGTARAEILGEVADWLDYDFPARLSGMRIARRHRGQRQKWYALRFLGADADVRLDLDPRPEFDAWRWAGLAELPGLAVDFKRPVYERLAAEFAPLAERVAREGPTCR